MVSSKTVISGYERYLPLTNVDCAVCNMLLDIPRECLEVLWYENCVPAIPPARPENVSSYGCFDA